MQALRKEPLTVYGDGKQTRSFQYVSDLVSILFSSLSLHSSGFHVVSNEINIHLFLADCVTTSKFAYYYICL